MRFSCRHRLKVGIETDFVLVHLNERGHDSAVKDNTI